MKEITQRTFNKTKILKWTVYTVAGLLLLMLLGGIFLQIYLEPLVRKEIRRTVSESSKGLYIIDFEEIDISLFGGSAHLKNLSLKTDSAVYSKAKKSTSPPKYLLNIKTDGIYFSNINPINIYFRKRLHLNSIKIEKPHIHIDYRNAKTHADTTEKKTVYQLISKALRSLTIGQILINKAVIDYKENSSGTPKETKLKDLNVRISEVRIDSTSQHDKTRLYYSKDIFIQMKNHQYTTRDGLYKISVGDLWCSTQKQTAELNSIQVVPLYPEMEFSRKYKTQHDRYDINVRRVTFRNIDFLQLDTEKGVFASLLTIDGARVNIFMNRELPPVTFDKARNYPHQALKRLKLNTRINTVKIRDAAISYSEFNPVSGKKGTIRFSNFTATIDNVTNNPAALRKNNQAKASVSALLMNVAPLKATINFALSGENLNFSVHGTVGKMSMKSLASVARNLGMIEVESGNIYKAVFDIYGNRRTADGTVKFYYDNLKLNLLKKEDDSKKLKKRGFLSSLANALVIKDSNPEKNGDFRIGKAAAERLNSGSFFNLIWKSVFAGLKQSIGLTLQKVEEVKPKKKEKAKRK